MHDYLTWQNSLVLRWLWLVPALAVLVWYAMRARQRSLSRFLGTRFVATIGGGIGCRVPGSLLVLAFSRLSSPRRGRDRHECRRSSKGVDVVLCIDTSDSMLAQDAANRLEAARMRHRLIGASATARLVFAGSSYLYSPLTIDHDAAATFVSSIERGSAWPRNGHRGCPQLGDRDTQGGRPVTRPSSTGDGEPPRQAGRCHGASVRASWCTPLAWAGRSRTDPHPRGERAPAGRPTGHAGQVFDPAARARGRVQVQEDRNGSVVMTRMNEAPAGRGTHGGGVFVKSLERANVDKVFQAVAGMESAAVGSYEFTQYAERFQWPLGIALLLIAIECMVAAAPRRKPGDADDS